MSEQPKICIRCKAETQVLHSVHPGNQRNSCAECQGKANRQRARGGGE